jgi:hypothetical protein
MLYLDLEETIIAGWDNPTFINSAKIRKYLRDNRVKEVIIYSFAIQNDCDRESFNFHLKERIEEYFNISVIQVLTLLEIMEVVKKYDRIQYSDTYDFTQINGKYFSFLKYCLMENTGEISILIDDCVPDCISHYSNPETTIRTISVENLRGYENDYRTI